MTKTKPVECLQRLQATVDQLHAQGAEPAFIVSALIELTIKAAKLDHARAPAHLDDASDTLAVAAHNLRGDLP